MNIFQLQQFLTEYNNLENLTTLTTQSEDGTTGKSLDNIAAGITNPCKQDKKKTTENEKRFPNLTKVINQMKNDSIKGEKLVIGIALNELQLLAQTMKLRTDEKGETILPFGNDVRLIQKGNNYFIKLSSSSNKEKQPNQTNIMGLNL